MKDQDYILFEAYLAGNLTQDDVQTHQARLENDQKYKESFELYQSINKHLKDEWGTKDGLDHFKKDVSAVSQDYFQEQKKSSFPWMKMAVAACLILALGLYFLLGEFSKPQYDAIAQIPTAHLTQRSADGEIYSHAETAFNDGQYAEAISLFDQIIEEDAEAQSILLYQAIAYMEMGAEDKARTIYNEIIQENTGYSEEALWFAALNELKSENYKACKEYLHKIEPSASRYKEAKELLGKL